MRHTDENSERVIRRTSAKVLLVDEAEQILLIRGTDPSEPEAGTWWFPVGGGVEPGEDVAKAARREVEEETGLVLESVGEPEWYAENHFTFDGQAYEQHELYFVAHVPNFVPDLRGHTELERRSVVELRWCRIDDLLAAGESFYPEDLAERLSDCFRRRTSVIDPLDELGSPPDETDSLRRVRAVFKSNAFDFDPPEGCAVWAHLARHAARSETLLQPLLEAPPNLRRASLLFSAMHLLLLQQVEEAGADESEVPALARWFPTIVDTPWPIGPALGQVFDEFTAAHSDALSTLMKTSSIQLNEVGRAPAVLHAVNLVRRAFPLSKRLALVELGCSAGFLLALDKYTYFDEESRPDTPHLAPVLMGTPHPDARTDITIARRIGVDLQPIDPSDPSALSWLQANVWASHRERFDRVRQAAGAVGRVEIERVVGDAAACAEILERLPQDELPVLITSWTLPYLSDEERHDLFGRLREIGANRDLAVVCLEPPCTVPWRSDPSENSITPLRKLSLELSVTEWHDGVFHSRTVGFAHAQGHWIEVHDH